MATDALTPSVDRFSAKMTLTKQGDQVLHQKVFNYMRNVVLRNN